MPSVEDSNPTLGVIEVPGPKWQHRCYFDCELTLVAHGQLQFCAHNDDGASKKSDPGVEKDSIIINVSNMSNNFAQNFGKKKVRTLCQLWIAWSEVLQGLAQSKFHA